MINKQGPGKIDWTDNSWNPLSGCLGPKGDGKHCPYCYLKRIEKRTGSDLLTPKFKPEYLNDFDKKRKPFPDGTKIFVGSSSDVFGDWVKRADVLKVLEVVKRYPKYIFQFLTKNPMMYAYFDFPKNCWLGVTLDGYTIANYDRQQNFREATKKKDNIKFISFEPLISPIGGVFIEKWVDWIIIGVDSNKGAERPPDAWATQLIKKANAYHIPVWMKDNYKYPRVIKVFPKEVK